MIATLSLSAKATISALQMETEERQFGGGAEFDSNGQIEVFRAMVALDVLHHSVDLSARSRRLGQDGQNEDFGNSSFSCMSREN